MRKTALLAATGVAFFATALATTPALAGTGRGPEPNVMVCHFAGQTATTPWIGGGTTLTGDYVLNYTNNGPALNQVNYCLGHGGLGVIWVNANALQGLGAQLTDRVSQYPG